MPDKPTTAVGYGPEFAAFLARQGDATFLADVAGFVRELVRQCGGER